MNAAMILDLLVAVLLVATIVYAAMLNRRLKGLRRGKEELRTLIEEFTAATTRASSGMDELRALSDGSARHLKQVLDEAQALRDDLSFLIERGAVEADRLEGSVRGARGPLRRESAEGTEDDAGVPEEVRENLRRILGATR